MSSRSTWRLFRGLIDPTETRAETQEHLQRAIHSFYGDTSKLAYKLRDQYLCTQQDPRGPADSYADSENAELHQVFQLHDLKAALAKMKRGTAPGRDKITVQRLANLPDPTYDTLLVFINSMRLGFRASAGKCDAIMEMRDSIFLQNNNSYSSAVAIVASPPGRYDPLAPSFSTLQRMEKRREGMALSEKRRGTWLALINRKDLKTLSNVRVCGRHFITGRPAKLFDETNHDWALNKLMGHGCKQPAVTKPVQFDRRKMRVAKNAAVSAVGALGESCEVVAPSMGNTTVSNAAHTEAPSSPVYTASPDCRFTATDRDAATQTDVTVADLKALEEDNQRLTSELHVLEIQKSQLEITESSLHEDPETVCFYTGFPNFTVLFAVYQLIEVSVKHTPQRCFGKFQEFVMFLMKLKWNFPLQDLVYRFGVSESTI
ncbi:hypothetical protein HPB49_007261 [Dermacentor silvarum]|uniref:Uncharacterized protein n=1 Tax=Dermacentor silvarum TaxID=543639 RepID=A0ACB8CK11_DERSI|nr:hypothetical protein HPB49_007261 [Dermacentor silvarum]